MQSQWIPNEREGLHTSTVVSPKSHSECTTGIIRFLFLAMVMNDPIQIEIFKSLIQISALHPWMKGADVYSGTIFFQFRQAPSPQPITTPNPHSLQKLLHPTSRPRELDLYLLNHQASHPQQILTTLPIGNPHTRHNGHLKPLRLLRPRARRSLHLRRSQSRHHPTPPIRIRSLQRPHINAGSSSRYLDIKIYTTTPIPFSIQARPKLTPPNAETQ